MPEAQHVASGKVRELYALDDDRLLLVASDRISTFDVVLPTEIPDKGRVLTGLSGYWFTLLRSVVPNHMLEIRDDGRSMECRRLEMLPIECVVRGYLAGSGWKDYRATGATSGTTTVGAAAKAGPANGVSSKADARILWIPFMTPSSLSSPRWDGSSFVGLKKPQRFG